MVLAQVSREKYGWGEGLPVEMRLVGSTATLPAGRTGNSVWYYEPTVLLPNHNPNHWRLGIFYFNRQDRRLLVPKRSGFGWTLNFAHLGAWLIIVAVIALLVSRLLMRGVRGRT